MTEYYFELTIKPSQNYKLFLDLLISLTSQAIEEDNGSLISRSEEDLSNVEFGILQFAQALDVKCETKHEKKENIDWIKQYQQSVKSVLVGNFFIRPSWDKALEDKINIIIDPALSFGSGHHETTASCIEAIDKFVEKQNTVLDVGTGSGILAIAAEKKGASVDICDTDEVCIKDTASNFKLNEAVFQNSWIGSASKASKTYDVVIANIVADVLAMIAKDLKKCLNANGTLIISGILDKHIDRVLNKFKDLEKINVIQKNEWVTVIFKNNKEL